MTYTESITLVKRTCGGCGGTFAINEVFHDAKKREGGGWHCPYCGEQRGYYEHSTVKILERELAQEKAARDQAEMAVREARKLAEDRQIQLAAAQRESKKLKTRAAAGVCAFCHRTVSQMARHMKSKHPELVTAK